MAGGCARLSPAVASQPARVLSEGQHFPAPQLQSENMCEEVLSCLVTMYLGSGLESGTW